jgi:hypothetical protein
VARVSFAIKFYDKNRIKIFFHFDYIPGSKCFKTLNMCHNIIRVCIEVFTAYLVKVIMFVKQLKESGIDKPNTAKILNLLNCALSKMR